MKEFKLYLCASCGCGTTHPERGSKGGWWCPRCYSNQKTEAMVVVEKEESN